MSTINLSKIEKLYSDGIREHGPTPQSVGWKDENAQNLRFEMLLRVLVSQQHDIQDTTINELGCGYGALIPILEQRLGNNLSLYRGYDISQEALNSANELHAGPNIELKLNRKITDIADYSITSGIFNVKFDANDVEWETYIKATLDNMAVMSRVGFAFNILTDMVDFRRPHLYYANPTYLFDWCRKHYSPRVSLLHEYPLYEFTILVWL